MNRAKGIIADVVPPEEVARRIEEYRRLGGERGAPAQVVYHAPMDACPWPGCTEHIAGINFQLDTMGARDFVAKLLKAWWSGTGLTGNCPGCGQRVLFSLADKTALSGPAPAGAAELPMDWAKRARLVIHKH